ncbi:MAG: S26 family signal peptidase [Spirochaetales bacterium]|nr:MAG: S26 family signal peptidase [Spirochaetales bacterium]
MSTTAEPDWLDKLQTFTEKLLTNRARRQEKKRRKQKARGVLMEWLDAFAWAIMIVLLLNQYLFQAYQIPSGSMRHTLIGGKDPYTNERNVSDRIFVDKMTFGPELLPGVAKLPAFRLPQRGEVIIFENPEYQSPSLLHEIVQRVLYMATLSLVDLNRKDGQPAVQLLIKRLVAENGDTVKFHRGHLFIKPVGEKNFLPEEEFKNYSSLEYGNQLLLDEAYYDKMHATIEAVRTDRAGLPVDPALQAQAEKKWVSPLAKNLGDFYEQEQTDVRFLRTLFPQDSPLAFQDVVYRQGIYVPRGWVLPLGDNRSDSLDGRYFGPVRKSQILGRAMFIYWPLNRMGNIR